MKKFILFINIFIFSYFIAITKGDICPPEYISISALGKCKKIIDILEGKDLALKTENLFYLSNHNEGIVKKSGYRLEIFKLNDTKLQSHNARKSKLYISDTCITKMENNIPLDKNRGIAIIVHDSNNLNNNNITDNYFIILYNNSNSEIAYINSKNYHFSFCNEETILLDDEIDIHHLKYSNGINNMIDINKVMYGRKNGIDLFDPESGFFKDICFKFKSEKGSDVPLESRLEDYYQNISFCNERENSHYLSYNYSANTSIITYRCTYGYYKDEEDKASSLDKINNELKSVVSVSNLNLFKCYKNFLNLRDIVRNYGGMICIVVLIYQIICFLIFCFYGIKSIKNKLDDLFLLGKKIIHRLEKKTGLHFGLEREIEIMQDNENNGQGPKKLFNLWGQIKRLKKKGLLKQRRRQRMEGLKLKDSDNKSSDKMNSDKSGSKESEGVKIEINDIDDDVIKKHLNSKNKNDQPLRQRTEGENMDSNTKIFPFQKGKKIKTNSKDNEVKSENSQIYDYESDELNELPYDKAIKYDKRGFCIYYGNILMSSHIILSVFFRYNDYNLFTIKLGLLLMTFPISLAFNILFFTNKKIKLTYIKSKNDINSFWNNISNSILSSILASILLIMLKVLSLTHNSVRALRKLRDINYAEKKSKCILRMINIRIVIYYILSFVFLFVFGFYVLCFCSVFENTQFEVIKSTLISWFISLIYPFIICFLTSLVRKAAFDFENKYIYAAKLIMQLF